MQQIRVIEAFRNLFYSPLYVALSLGIFESEDLELSVQTRSPGQDAISMLRSGEVDIALTGPMRCFVAADRGESNIPLSFIEVNSRDGFMLLSREPMEPFDWRSLEGRTVLTYREPPTPWMCLLTILTEQNVDISKVQLSLDRPIAEALEAFRDGFADFIELPEPLAEELISAGLAHLAAPAGRFAGAVPYSSFAATPEFLSEKRDLALRFTRAFYSAQQWLQTAGAAEVAKLVSPHLPGVSLAILTTGVERYQAQGTWPGDPLLRQEGFYRLHKILQDGGLIKAGGKYEDLVTADLAQAVMSGSKA